MSKYYNIKLWTCLKVSKLSNLKLFTRLTMSHFLKNEHVNAQKSAPYLTIENNYNKKPCSQFTDLLLITKL